MLTEKKQMEIALTVACRERINIFKGEMENAVEECETAKAACESLKLENAKLVEDLEQVKGKLDKKIEKYGQLKEVFTRLRNRFYEIKEQYHEVLEQLEESEKIGVRQSEIIKAYQKRIDELEERLHQPEEEEWGALEAGLNNANMLGKEMAGMTAIFNAPVTINHVILNKQV